MKRVLSLILLILTVFSLSACHYGKSGDILEPVSFYYPRNTHDFIYGAADGVIAAEVREGSGHIGDLNYMLTMYLRGPQEETLRSPFPDGCILENVYTKDDTLYVRFSGEFADLDNLEQTIACAAVAKTCLSMTDLQYICIESISDTKSIQTILQADSMLYSDHSAFESHQKAE